MMRRMAVGLAVLLAGPAAAHVTLEPAAAPAGSYARAAFRVPHGCAGAATTSIRVRLPASIPGARPMPHPGWTLRTVVEELPVPVGSGHGQLVRDRVAEVVWEGGALPDDQYDEFVMLFAVPDRPGEAIPIPVVQGCAGGASTAWEMVASPGTDPMALATPAPVLRLLPRAGAAAVHH